MKGHKFKIGHLAVINDENMDCIWCGIILDIVKHSNPKHANKTFYKIIPITGTMPFDNALILESSITNSYKEVKR